jgi:hypothetical protein|tara:strand:- start:40489 stop:40719 length:231 start_codon:yes stop_codon:yes gene_type:complete
MPRTDKLKYFKQRYRWHWSARMSECGKACKLSIVVSGPAAEIHFNHTFNIENESLKFAIGLSEEELTEAMKNGALK